MNRLLDQLPLNTLRNNMTGQTYQFQSGKAPVGLIRHAPCGTWAKAYYGKDDPTAVYDAEGNKIANLIADVAANNRDQDALT